MIVQETISLDLDEAGFVHIHHVQIENSGLDMGGPMWFERASLDWVRSSLRACLDTYASKAVETRLGQDDLKVYESGHEQAPIVNLRNRRPKDATHGGVFALMMSKPIAEELCQKLAAV
ncbi:hypothetical protein [Haliangium sp.]|uniref:hypothetical protein n=1 Tax=Haliangium sp. TaxID=2663208 RepID=UPI003D100149